MLTSEESTHYQKIVLALSETSHLRCLGATEFRGLPVPAVIYLD